MSLILTILLSSPGSSKEKESTSLERRIQSLEDKLQQSLEREKKLEERLQKLEEKTPTPAQKFGAVSSAVPEQDHSRALDWPKDQNGMRQVVLGGFDVHGFIDARFIFDENVLFDGQEMFDFRLQEVELDIIKRFPKIVYLRADVDFIPNRIFLEQGFVGFLIPFGRTIDTRLGKFNSPIGTEGQDAPNKIFINPSLIHQLALPENFTGLAIAYPFIPQLKAYAIVANGWDLDRSVNEMKTLAARLEWKTGDAFILGLSAGIGQEQLIQNKHYRRFIVLDGVMHPLPRLDFTFDMTYGNEDQAFIGFLPNGLAVFKEAKWWGGQATLVYQFTRWLDAGGRYEFFKDDDGARAIASGNFRSLFPRYPGQSVMVNAFSGLLRFHIVEGTDFNIEYQWNYSANQNFLGLDGFFNHQENLITFQAVSVF